MRVSIVTVTFAVFVCFHVMRTSRPRGGRKSFFGFVARKPIVVLTRNDCVISEGCPMSSVAVTVSVQRPWAGPADVAATAREVGDGATGVTGATGGKGTA